MEELKPLTRDEIEKKIEMFYNALKPYAKDSGFFMSVMLGQVGIESYWGTSTLAKKANNFTGHKFKAPFSNERPNDYFIKDAGEEVDGEKVVYEDEKWRKYKDIDDWAKHHADWLTQSDWYKGHYREAINAKTPEEQLKALTGVYATDSSYATSVMRVINDYGLKKYDGIKEDSKEEEPMAQKRTFKDVAKQVYGTEVINWDGFKGIGAGNRGGSPKGAIIHNDYGRANGKGYISWLTSSRIPNPSAGYAHYYHDRKYAVRAVPTTQGAWHAGDFARGNFTGHGKPANYGNMQLLGYEVNESLSTTREQFRLNEEVVFMQVAEDFLFYGIKPSRQTVWLHREYTSTTCPHRSWDIHVGGTNNASNRNKLKDYFIGRIQFWMDVLEGKKDIPTKNYLPEKHGEVASEPVNVTNPQGMKSTKQKPYKAPRIPWDKHKVGDVVEVAKNFQWLDTSTYELLQSPNYNTIVGTKDKIVEIMQIPDDKQGNHSQTAYKLEKYNSWITEEYLVESMNSWELVDEDESHVEPTPPAPSYDGNYVHWNGKKYKVGEEIK